MARKWRPQIVLMDISMPIVNGLEATRQIRADNPSSKVIVLSAHVGFEYSDRAKKAGAVGYVAKLISAEALSWAIHQVSKGRKLCDPVVSAKFVDEEGSNSERNGPPKTKNRRLTCRESDVLGLMAEGFPRVRIAAKLRVGSSSIEKSVGALMEKLGVPTIAGLVAYAAAFYYVENDVQLTIT
jgi:DNA-binding NarL/FixJ family response regulator